VRRLAAALACTALCGAAQAVVILDSTWAANGGSEADPASGFGAHIALANRPQFDAAVSFSADGEVFGACSGTWIGNFDGAGYVLTAGHCFEDGAGADAYVYRAHGGGLYQGTEIFVHPRWNGDLDTRTGYDLAIVRLDRDVEDAGPQPFLYAGNAELGRIGVMVGFGSRGIGSVGEEDRFYAITGQASEKAAAEGRIDEVTEAARPFPKKRKADAGNYLAVFMPDEDGSFENPHGGPARPATPMIGLLGSGDSGGGLWIPLGGSEWAVAGIASNGGGNAEYGQSSWFARVSQHRDWITSMMPAAAFAE
jgi:hypothetical protein